VISSPQLSAVAKSPSNLMRHAEFSIGGQISAGKRAYVGSVRRQLPDRRQYGSYRSHCECQWMKSRRVISCAGEGNAAAAVSGWILCKRPLRPAPYRGASPKRSVSANIIRDCPIQNRLLVRVSAFTRRASRRAFAS